MTRSEFIRRLVLNAICDDFENVDQVILPEVTRVGAKCGLAVHRSDVLEALCGLVGTGLAKAYHLSGTDRDPFSGEIQGMPSLAIPEKDFRTYFYVTKQGTDFHLADSTWWPLDDGGELRPDWKPPDR
ncbi:MAG: hypothetical protein ABSH45_03515 [Bryobacteraceae bacterium]|jgi:hypothetical protein